MTKGLTWPLLMGWTMLSCGGGPNQCEANLTLEMADGTETTLDFCSAHEITANFEFDPDDRPEVREVTFRLQATISSGFECWISVAASEACDEGRYCVSDQNQIQLDISDCEGVGDSFEGSYLAKHGFVRFDAFEVPDKTGNLSGEEFQITMSGSIDASAGAVRISGDFLVSGLVKAADSEEKDCTRESCELRACMFHDETSCWNIDPYSVGMNCKNPEYAFSKELRAQFDFGVGESVLDGVCPFPAVGICQSFGDSPFTGTNLADEIGLHSILYYSGPVGFECGGLGGVYSEFE